MYVKKIHQFLSNIEKDAHKRKLVLFFVPRGVYSICLRETDGKTDRQTDKYEECCSSIVLCYAGAWQKLILY